MLIVKYKQIWTQVRRDFIQKDYCKERLSLQGECFNLEIYKHFHGQVDKVFSFIGRSEQDQKRSWVWGSWMKRWHDHVIIQLIRECFSLRSVIALEGPLRDGSMFAQVERVSKFRGLGGGQKLYLSWFKPRSQICCPHWSVGYRHFN